MNTITQIEGNLNWLNNYPLGIASNGSFDLGSARSGSSSSTSGSGAGLGFCSLGALGSFFGFSGLAHASPPLSCATNNDNI